MFLTTTLTLALEKIRQFWRESTRHATSDYSRCLSTTSHAGLGNDWRTLPIQSGLFAVSHTSQFSSARSSTWLQPTLSCITTTGWLDRTLPFGWRCTRVRMDEGEDHWSSLCEPSGPGPTSTGMAPSQSCERHKAPQMLWTFQLSPIGQFCDHNDSHLWLSNTIDIQTFIDWLHWQSLFERHLYDLYTCIFNAEEYGLNKYKMTNNLLDVCWFLKAIHWTALRILPHHAKVKPRRRRLILLHCSLKKLTSDIWSLVRFWLFVSKPKQLTSLWMSFQKETSCIYGNYWHYIYIYSFVNI